MTDRVDRLYKHFNETRVYPICVEKATIFTKVFRENDGWPMIVKRARATAEYLDKRTIFIEDDELLVGSCAAKPMGMEVKPLAQAWPDDDLQSILDGGLMTLSEEEHKQLRELDDYWILKGRTTDERQGFHYDDERLFPFIRRGFLCPPWKDKKLGRGSSAAGDGWSAKTTPYCLFTADFETIIKRGIRSYLDEAYEEQRNLRFYTTDDVEKGEFLYSAILVMEALIRIANRYADLAEKMAAEEKNPVRAEELRQIAETCRRVPEYPPRTFREAMQAFIFQWLMMASAGLGGSRFDRYMYPYYKADLDAGRITRDEALELLELLRIKYMQFGFVGGGKFQREKWSGMARWNNFLLGGHDSTGKETSNEITELFMEAAFEVRTPHPTMTIVVNEDTPQWVMDKALELVATGCGFPAFISEKQYTGFLQARGVDEADSYNFCIAGCLDLAMPGASREMMTGMFITPMVIELALNEGCNPATGEFLGVPCKKFEDFESWDEFYKAFLEEFDCCVGHIAEEHTIAMTAHRELYPDAYTSALARDGLKVGKDILKRNMPYENGAAINVVGMANTINCLASIKKLVFDDKKVSAKTLNDALHANWVGYEDIQKLCLEVPKYGNDDDYVDSIGVQYWNDVKTIIESYKTLFGAPYITSAMSISAHAPGGTLTGATPDGRNSGDTLADGSISPVQGTDANGPIAVFNSAMKMAQGWSASLMNMKFTPSSLKTLEDRRKLGSVIKTFMLNGGRQVQFNVVDTKTLLEAKTEKVKYRDLLVRVAGYSTYFVNLSDKVQNEIINRNEHVL